MSKKSIFLECINNHNNKLTINQIRQLTGLSRTTILRYCDEFNYDVVKFKEPWNKGLDKYSNPSLLNISNKLSGKKRKSRTDQEKQRISVTMKENKISGGIRESSGRGDKHVYNGITLNSDSALGVIKMFDRESIKWEKSKRNFSYLDENGESRFVMIDFYLPEYDLYVVVKTNATSTVINKLMKVKKENNLKLLIIDELMYNRLMYNIVTDILKKFINQ